MPHRRYTSRGTPEAPELGTCHLPRVANSNGVVWADGVECFVDFGDMHGHRIPVHRSVDRSWPTRPMIVAAGACRIDVDQTGEGMRAAGLEPARPWAKAF